ncbi:MAG: pantoate--beta-alanine ligase [candidate division Zixibacteria bacterium]|nr:pantoate--beta-alanine ligase [candidate division Zixibacteria bacterium]
MLLIPTVRRMQATSRSWQKKGLTVGLVPTMGYLHEGHLALIKRARNDCDRVIVSIFVNPLQFGPAEDFERYPRDLKKDRGLCLKAGADALFVPLSKEMYPADFQTYVEVEKVSQGLEGAARPGHFRGVATVVAKLFNACLPDAAYFGQKDYQQAALIRQMVADLNFPLKIVVCPTVRETSGLAASSRNSYLGESERREAAVLYQALLRGAEKWKAKFPPEEVMRIVKDYIKSHSNLEVEYVETSDPKTLLPAREAGRPAVISLAARSGKVRLIDNILVGARLTT